MCLVACRAKEEKLRQVSIMERAYQGSLLELRQAWQRELENIKVRCAPNAAAPRGAARVRACGI